MAAPTPRPVRRAMADIGGALRNWRRLDGLTIEQVAERAGISASTVKRIEAGHGASLEHVLRVARAVGVLEELPRAVDPLRSDRGRLRAEELLGGRRVRGRTPGSRP